MIPIDCQFANRKAVECPSSSRRLGPRLFPSIEGNDRGPDAWDEFTQHPMSMDCQLRSKIAGLAEVQKSRDLPWKISWGSSRPMRSQHSRLSTNERPRFRPDSGLFPNFEPSNPLPIEHFSMAAQMEFDSTSNGMPIVFQFNATWLSFECQLIANWIQIDLKCNTNWLSIGCQCIANWMPLDCQLYVNWLPM